MPLILSGRLNQDRDTLKSLVVHKELKRRGSNFALTDVGVSVHLCSQALLAIVAVDDL